MHKSTWYLLDSLGKNLACEPVTEVFVSVRNDRPVKEILTGGLVGICLTFSRA